MSDATPTVVLVHGAFADASSWNGVIADLTGRGFPVIAAANPLRSLSTDAATIKALVQSVDGPVILVGHSYGGAVITGAGTDDRVVGLVYIAANCYAAISIIDYPQRWCTDADADEAVQQRIRAGTRARLHHHWELFADVFGNSPYLGGNELNALDLLAAVVSKWSGARQHLARHRPAFNDTLQRIESHPDVAAVFARHWPPTSKASTPNAAT